VTLRSVALSVKISTLRNLNIAKRIAICLPMEKIRHVWKNNMNSQRSAKVIFRNQREVPNISLMGT